MVRCWPPGKAPLVGVFAFALLRTERAGLCPLRCLPGFCLMMALAVPVPFAWYLSAQDSGDGGECSSRGPEPIDYAPQMGEDVRDDLCQDSFLYPHILNLCANIKSQAWE